MVDGLVRIEGFDLPGRTCGPGPEFPVGHHDIHVAVQARKGQLDLFGLVPADVTSTTWTLDCDLVSPPPAVDLRGPQIQGSPRKRFVYVTWGVVEPSNPFRMFRRAKIWLDTIPADTLHAACECGLLIGRLGLTDEKGWSIGAAVRRPHFVVGRLNWTPAGRMVS
jgi:hypothetical protein